MTKRPDRVIGALFMRQINLFFGKGSALKILFIELCYDGADGRIYPWETEGFYMLRDGAIIRLRNAAGYAGHGIRVAAE